MHLPIKTLSFIAALTTMAPIYANDAVTLLNQMNDALHTLEYQGKLIYLKDGEASTLAIKHTLEAGAEKEVVSLLDDNNSEDYVRERELSAFSLSSMPKITPEMQKIYSFDMGGIGKVAGRPCRIVLARPKDRKRYLQKYCIDLDHHVVLKYSLINQKHEPVERFMFTDFEVISSKEKVADGEVNQTEVAKVVPLIGENSKTTHAQPAEKPSTKNKPATKWFFDSLPTGFSVVSVDKQENDYGEDEQIIISDGLSSVSVFISAHKIMPQLFKPIRSGALNILSRDYQGHAVTLVGEVPKATLQDIYKAIKKAPVEK